MIPNTQNQKDLTCSVENIIFIIHIGLVINALQSNLTNNHLCALFK